MFEKSGSGMSRMLRVLMRRPAYTAVAVLTLGLGIGANVAIFTVVDSVLLRPLPYPGSERIVRIRHHAPGIDLAELNNAAGLIRLYREEAGTLASITATDGREANLTGAGRPARVRVVATDTAFFDVFTTQPEHGRAFSRDDIVRGAAPVAILMHDEWQSRFGGDVAALGKRIELDGRSTEIVGVMPAGFLYPDDRTVALVPLQLDPADAFRSFGLTGLARLETGADIETARAQLTALQKRLPDLWQGVTSDFFERAGWSVSADRLRDLTVSDIERALWVLFGTAGLVLLIASANVANLFLVRAESRRREVAIRTALGASRGRIAGTFVAESTLLGLGGGIAGTLLAWMGVSLLVATGPASLPRLHEIGMNAAGIGFAALLSLLAGALLGLLPLAGRSADSVTVALREGGRTMTASRRRQQIRSLLVISQVAMAMLLLAGSGLLMRSAARLRNVDSGFRADRVLTFRVAWGDSRDRAEAIRFYNRALTAIAAIPGVESIGAVNALPLDPVSLNGGSFHIESQPLRDEQLPPTAFFSAVTPGWFETLGIRLIAGRYPQRRDDTGGPPVVWINQRFAQERFPDGAIGQRIAFGDDGAWAEIAGVVANVRTFRLSEEAGRMAYFPLSTTVNAGISVLNFAVRGRDNTLALMPAIRTAVSRIEPDVPITSARMMDDVVTDSMASMSFTTALVAIAAAVALLLGAVGLYGVISRVVARRMPEMGVRIALGAQPADVRFMVVRQALTATLAGIATGLLAATLAFRPLASLLFGVSTWDAPTFIAVPLILIAVSVLAAWLPAYHAASADPMTAMRVE